jgi:hypothetical protein
MTSGFTAQQKTAMILDSLIPMLKNDLNRVCDSTCNDHGRPGSGPNFTAAMLCLVTCEVMGRLFSDPALEDDAATASFLRNVSRVSGDLRYDQAATALIAYFRHGIVHSFMPKQPLAVRGRVSWALWKGGEASICVELLRGAAGATTLAQLRLGHLVVSQEQGERLFTVIPQVLYVDVVSAVDDFAQKIRSGDRATSVWFEAGFEKWWGRTSSIRGQLDQGGRAYLGI